MLYPAIAGALLGLTLASLDRAWTKAMWPKPGSAAGPSNDGWHLFWFHIGTRSMFAAPPHVESGQPGRRRGLSPAPRPHAKCTMCTG